MEMIKYILLFDWCAVFGTASGTYAEVRSLMFLNVYLFAIYNLVIFGIYVVLEVIKYNEVKKINYFYVAFLGGLGVLIPVCPFITYIGIYFFLKFLNKRMIRDLQAAREHLLSGNIDYDYNEKSMLQQVEWNRKTEEEKEEYKDNVNNHFRNRTKVAKVVFLVVYSIVVVNIAILAI